MMGLQLFQYRSQDVPAPRDGFLDRSGVASKRSSCLAFRLTCAQLRSATFSATAALRSTHRTQSQLAQCQHGLGALVVLCAAAAARNDRRLQLSEA